VLQLTLGDAGTYSWSFKNAAGSSVSDSGSGTCLPEEASTPAPGGDPDRARPGDRDETSGGAGSARRWAFRGISDRTREAARAAAEEAGMPVGAWVEQALRRALEAGTAPSPLEGVELGELEAMVRQVVAEELQPVREALEHLGSEGQAAGARAAEREARRR
jgi:hypothetical protein